MIKKINGFTLIELLVGMVVGLLIISASYSVTTYFTNGAKSAGSINLALQDAIVGSYIIEKDIRQAGLGMTSNNVLLCNAINIYNNGIVIADNKRSAPVLIIDGGAGSDTIETQYSDSILAGAPSQTLTAMANSNSIIAVNNGTTYNVGDLILIGKPNLGDPCTLMSVSGVAVTSFGTQLSHNSGGANVYNPPNPGAVFSDAPSYQAASTVLNVKNQNWSSYGVSNKNQLVMKNIITNNDVAISDNIMDMQAQYGITDGTSQDISQWVDATGAFDSTVITYSDILKIRAIRYSFLVRAPKKDITCSTAALPNSWTGGPAFKAMANADWNCYKYRAYNVIAPIKNVVYAYN